MHNYEDPIEVNGQLNRIGHSIDVRCVYEFLSKADVTGLRLATWCQVCMILWVKHVFEGTCQGGGISKDHRGVLIYLQDNPLSIFVELLSGDEQFGESGDELTHIVVSGREPWTASGRVERAWGRPGPFRRQRVGGGVNHLGERRSVVGRGVSDPGKGVNPPLEQHRLSTRARIGGGDRRRWQGSSFDGSGPVVM